MSVMTMISELFAEPAESRSESQSNRKAESQVSKAKSQESQKSQPRVGKTHQKSKKDACDGCKHSEDIPSHGTGCTYKTNGEYPNIWNRQDTLEECPRGYWN